MDHYDAIKCHYEDVWSNIGTQCVWDKGPAREPVRAIKILEFPPTALRNMWTYATCGMSSPLDQNPIELHLFSNSKEPAHVELLTVIAHYHRTGAELGLNHTVNFGRPWYPDSACEHGLISLPYLDGPNLEMCPVTAQDYIVKCLWLIPITSAEAAFAKSSGLDALEEAFEERGLDYLGKHRQSVV